MDARRRRPGRLCRQGSGQRGRQTARNLPELTDRIHLNVWERIVFSTEVGGWVVRI